MANEAFKKVPLTLGDENETEVILRPLNIGRLRKFMAAWEEFQSVDAEKDATAGFDVFVNCAGIALEQQLQDQFENPVKEKAPWLSKDYRDYLEDTLDMDTIYKVLEVCGDLKLRQLVDDPNLMEALANQGQDGTN